MGLGSLHLKLKARFTTVATALLVPLGLEYGIGGVGGLSSEEKRNFPEIKTCSMNDP